MCLVSKPTYRSLLLFCLVVCASQSSWADRIILRNLESIEKTVVAFDVDGIQFDDGKTLGWGQIKSGRVDQTKQAAFNQYVDRLGEPLYRIRIRLQNQDYKDILEQAEALYPRYQDRQSNTAFMVSQALMWSRLAHGKRAAAVAPYLRCYAYLRAQRKTQVPIPGDRVLRFDPVTGMTPEIQPLWFDADEAKAALAELGQTIGKLPKPLPPAARIYYATMAMTAGNYAAAERVLAGLAGAKGSLAELLLIANVQSDLGQGKDSGALAKLCAAESKISDPNRALALYWCGVGTAKADLDGGLLLLMRVAALHSQSHPELAAAALAAAGTEIQNQKSDHPLHKKRVSILRRELLRSFPGSYHAQQILAELNVATDDPS